MTIEQVEAILSIILGLKIISKTIKGNNYIVEWEISGQKGFLHIPLPAWSPRDFTEEMDMQLSILNSTPRPLYCIGQLPPSGVKELNFILEATGKLKDVFNHEMVVVYFAIIEDNKIAELTVKGMRTWGWRVYRVYTIQEAFKLITAGFTLSETEKSK